ncbi:MAG: HdeD family acid-resistance protein [Cyanobacteria bacterium J06623_5]
MNSQKHPPNTESTQAESTQSVRVPVWDAEVPENELTKQQQAKSRRSLRAVSGWAIALGIVMFVLGIAAFISPIIAGAAAGVLLGWLFIFGSIVQAVDIFKHHQNSRSVLMRSLLCLLYLGAGLLVAFNPLAGAASLTLIIGVFFFIDGVFRVVLAFQVKPAPRWGWMLLNGIVMVILGIFIWSQWPYNAPEVLGIWIGVGLLFNGITTLLFGTAALATSIDKLNH